MTTNPYDHHADAGKLIPRVFYKRDGFMLLAFAGKRFIGWLWRTQTFTLDDWHAETPDGDTLNFTTHTNAVRWLLGQKGAA